MNTKFLTAIGIAALLGVAGLSAAALVTVKEKLDVTIESEQAAARRGPDPLALLGADIGAARDEVRVLGEGVGERLQLLHDTLEASAAERARGSDAAIAGLRAELAALRARLDQESRASSAARAETGVALVKLGEGLQSIATALEHGPGSADAIAPIDIAVADPALAAEPEPETVAHAVEPALEPAPAKAATKGFLSFQVPAQAFAFDRRQRYAIVPSLSRVGFDARSTLHDFSGVTTSIEGEITANLAHPADGCGGSVRAKAASLSTGLEGRDESMRELLEPAKHPELRFDWVSFEASNVDAGAQKVAGVARGRLTIHGVTKDVAMPVVAAVDGSKRLSIEGQTKIRMSDYGVKPPSKLGVISVEDEATLWIALRARTLGPAEEAAR